MGLQLLSRGMAWAVILVTLSIGQTDGQVKSLEVLVIDSPPFTCTDQAPCYSASSVISTVTAPECRTGSRRSKNGVCVHGSVSS